MANPYKEVGTGMNTISNDFAVKISTKCLERNKGLMFNLFDLGNLCFKGTQLYVFKNSIGDAIRLFLKKCEITPFPEAFAEFKTKLQEIARLSCSDGEQFGVFFSNMNKIMDELVIFEIEYRKNQSQKEGII